MMDRQDVTGAALEAAEALGGKPARDFGVAFLATGAIEDLSALGPHELGHLAAAAYAEALSASLPAPHVRLAAAESAGLSHPGLILYAVNEDKPFLYDSCLAELAGRGLTIDAAFHPVFTRPDGRKASVITLLIAAERRAERLTGLEDAARAVFADVGNAVGDWRAMLAALDEAASALKRNPPPVPPEELSEALAFLAWLAADNFTFLGARDYRFDATARTHAQVPGSGLGVLHDPGARIIRRDDDPDALTPEVLGFLTAPEPIIITKSNMTSRVHRRVAQDYIGVKRFDAAGRLEGEWRFVGLFTSAAYRQLPGEIPLLRRKAAIALAATGFDPKGHDGKSFAHVIDTFPREELFQIGGGELLSTALGVMHLAERPRVKSYLRPDRFGRFVSALIYMPRDRYSAAVRQRIEALLASAYDGEVSLSNPAFFDSPVARLHITIRRRPGPMPEPDGAALAAAIEAATRSWADRLAEALASSGKDPSGALLGVYAEAFPVSYRETIPPPDAVGDIMRLQAFLARDGGSGDAGFHVEAGEGQEIVLRVLKAGGPVELSSMLPLLETMGLIVAQETNHAIALPGGPEANLHIFRMRMKRPQPLRLAETGRLFEDALAAVWRGDAEADGFNALTLAAGLDWRSVAGLRACARYLRQIGSAFSLAYMEEALARNPDIAGRIARLFAIRFDPSTEKSPAEREARAKLEHERIEAALSDVKSLDDDRILRAVRGVAQACLRVNFFQKNADGGERPAMAFKIDPARIEGMPLPKPMAEIFVYSPRVEGVHLRFGKVARGGLRWSDRREDFRTEILGLVKAQQVKNAVIVPVGAKGGFYPKKLPVNASRDAVQAEGVAAYKIFVNALLDVTDTIAEDGGIVAPPQVVRHDGDDPYLVVAADKGTASFSDIANAISAERGFWLDDAFASGGSAGYDHKEMGITARGAWEAVKRHFREMGRDIQNEPFTAIGIGDMSGDVFGNGMLLSKATRLVAAFDHRDIFLDPEPDPARSWAERKRLFDLPRSSWADYDKSLISAGGGVFPRSAKAIPLSPEAKALTGLSADSVTPQELMKALLGSACDLLWFGGIGTYVKASTETHAEANDRANDAIRVDGRAIKALVIGEGANLGCTQAGRIEAARAGVRLNTDAIDNSAGVDTSDHEVNLKILFQGVPELARAERDALLTGMTEEVAGLVLRDNYLQTLALSVAEAGAAADLDRHHRLMRLLEGRGLLDRAVEGLPDDEAVRALSRAGLGLTRPELAVLLAYAKIALNQSLLDSTVPDDPGFAGDLARYFPKPVRERFPEAIEAHRLRRALVATILANDTVNRTGPATIALIAEASGATLAQAARAAAIAIGAFRLDALFDRINALDGKVASAVQTSMHRDVAALIERQTHWLIAHVAPDAPVDETAARFRNGIDALKGTFAGLVSPVEREPVEARIAELEAAGVPGDLADEAGALGLLEATPDIVLLAGETSAPLDAVAGAYFAAGSSLGIDRLRQASAAIRPQGHWETLALARASDDLYAIQRKAAARAIAGLHNWAGAGRAEGAGAVKSWVALQGEAVNRPLKLIAELTRDGAFSAAKLGLCAGQLRDAVG